MAHPNINERQAHVKRLIEEGIKIDSSLKRELCKKYSCSGSAIHADIVSITRPKTSETPFQSKSMRQKIFDRDGRVCQYCGDTEAYEYIVEHIIPAAIGGIARSYNLVIACQRCNAQKGREVWLPRNFERIMKDHPRWRDKAVELATKNYAKQEQ